MVEEDEHIGHSFWGFLARCFFYGILRKYGWRCVLDGPDALAEARMLQYY
jgi:hypothetical protein